jgi:hypothetical protein
MNAIRVNRVSSSRINWARTACAINSCRGDPPAAVLRPADRREYAPSDGELLIERSGRRFAEQAADVRRQSLRGCQFAGHHMGIELWQPPSTVVRFRPGDRLLAFLDNLRSTRRIPESRLRRSVRGITSRRFPTPTHRHMVTWRWSLQQRPERRSPWNLGPRVIGRHPLRAPSLCLRSRGRSRPS